MVRYRLVMGRPVLAGLVVSSALAIGACGQSRTSDPVPHTSPTASVRGVLFASLDHPQLPAGAPCPATKPNFARVTPPSGLRAILHGDLRGVYGHGSLWALIPTWRHTVSRDPNDGWYRIKIAWWSQAAGPLQIAARRIDKHLSTLGHGDIAQGAPSAARRIEPTNILVPTLGCWQVAGAVGTHVLTWILHAQT